MLSSLNKNIVLDSLTCLTDPLTGMPIGDKLNEKDIVMGRESVDIHLSLGYSITDKEKQLLYIQGQTLLAPKGILSVHLRCEANIQRHKVQDGLRSLPSIKNIIAVASGKGGVGKSTTSANVAIALASFGARVGVLDADIYGPSQPLLLGAKGKPRISDKKKMLPFEAHGIYFNSFGFLIEDDQAAIWRGPMVVQAMNQLLHLTEWPELDYLIVDMPPGTGDIALSLAQKVPVVGAVVVTTPQDIALLDVRKGAMMFNKVNVPVLGVIENMSVYTCPHCGHAEPIFGEDGGKTLARALQLDYLGGLPLDRKIRQYSDEGTPISRIEPLSESAILYQHIARKIAIKVSQLPKDMTHKFPPIVPQR